MLLRSLFIALAGTIPCMGQDYALVRLDTNYPAAMVYADSVALGPAHRKMFLVDPDARVLRLKAVGAYRWSIAPVEASLGVGPGDTVAVRLDFPSYHRVETAPFGASAYWVGDGGRVLMGTTPLVFSAFGKGSITVEMPGYELREVAARQRIWNKYRLDLYADDVTRADSQGISARYRRRRWIDYSAALLAVAAGAASVHHKFKADRLDRTYEKGFDPALVPRIRMLDNRAALSLGVMQVALGTLALRFIL